MDYSNTENYVLSEISKLDQLIEKTERELLEGQKMILARQQAIVQWKEMRVKFEQDLEKLNG